MVSIRKKYFILLILVLLLLLVMSCKPKQEIQITLNESNIINETEIKDKMRVDIVLIKNISNETIEELRLKGFKEVVESNDYTILKGTITKEELEQINKQEGIIKISEEIKKPFGSQISGQEDQVAIERLRELLNITKGPYIEQLVIKELDKKDSINVGIIFRLGQTEETYHKLIKEIDESTTEEELNSVDVIGMGRSFRAVINKDGLNKLKDNTNILEIGLIRQ